jgi:hypothetical protein
MGMNIYINKTKKKKSPEAENGAANWKDAHKDDKDNNGVVNRRREKNSTKITK